MSNFSAFAVEAANPTSTINAPISLTQEPTTEPEHGASTELPAQQDSNEEAQDDAFAAAQPTALLGAEDSFVGNFDISMENWDLPQPSA